MASTVLSVVAPSKALELPTPRGLFWFDRKNCWSSKIGYHETADKRRVRSQQYYPAPYTLQGLRFAEKQYRSKQVEWDQIVEKTRREDAIAASEMSFGGVATRRLPVWPPKTAPKNTSSQPTPTKVIANPEFVDLTITESVERHKDNLLKRTKLVGRNHLKPNSYNQMMRDLRLALAAHPDGPKDQVPLKYDLLLSCLSLTVLRDFYNYWHSSDLDLSNRTRKNYCKAFWKLLTDLEDDETLNFSIPKGATKVFRFTGDTAKIAEYDPEQLIATKKMAMERTWLFCLLALNCGQYQVDIAHLKMSEIVRLKDGKPVSLTRKELSRYDGSYDIYIRRVRNRTAHKYPYPALHWLFPETGLLLAKHIAPENEDDLVLLNGNGKPLYQSEVDSKNLDLIGKAYYATMANLEAEGIKPLCFKQYRKLGVSALGSIGDDNTVRLYRSQPPAGDAAMYQLDDYERKLTPHLRTWREKLIADGVL